MQEDVNQIYSDIQNGKTVDKLTTHELKFIYEVIEGLDNGRLRVCEKKGDSWTTNEWIKKAILLYFRLQKMDVMAAGDFTYYDKIPVKQWTEEEGVRVVPPAIARKGCFIEKGAILMPSYVNIGAYVGAGTMVDTWATVGSCAQIGKNVHLSGGVGIGGVLEPVQATPVIVEDNVFIGSRCIVVEGAVIEQGAVLGAGVTITASTKIIDVSGASPVEYKGRVPANSVVIPGTQMKDFAAGKFGVPCALIIGQRKPSTDLKTSLTDALRDYQVSV
ncbi:MAG: 2,3,4,5-tetrahydropyridine-2,6-dicarboxylate N-succinyltransferase [Bdellovibrio sp.]